MANCNLITSNVAASDLVTDALGTAGTPVSIRATANAYATHISLIDTQYRSVIENNIYRLRVVPSALGANFIPSPVATKLKVNPANLTGLSSKVAAKSNVIPFFMNLNVGLPVTYPTLKLSTTADFASGMFGVVNSKLYLSPAGLRVDLAAAPIGLALNHLPPDLNQILNLIKPGYIACKANLAVVKPTLTVGLRGAAAFKLDSLAPKTFILNLNLNLPSPEFNTQAATLAVVRPVLRMLGGIDAEDLLPALRIIPTDLNEILALIEPGYISCSATLAAVKPSLTIGLLGSAAFKLDSLASTLNLNLNLPSPQFRTQAATLAVVKPRLNLLLGSATAALALKHNSTEFPLNLVATLGSTTSAATLNSIRIPNTHIQMGITLFPAVSACKLTAVPVLNADFTTNPTIKDLDTGAAAFAAATTAALINISYVQTATNPVFSRLTSTVVKVPDNNVVIVPPPNFITLPVTLGSFAFTLKFASLALNEIMALSPVILGCKAASSSYMRLEAMPVPVAASSVVALKAGENLRLIVTLAVPATPPGASLGVIKSELTVVLSTLEGRATATSNSQLFTMRLLVGLFGTPKAALAANKPDLAARRLITELDLPTMPVVAVKLKAQPAYLPYGGPSSGGANSYVMQEVAKYPMPTGTSMATAVAADGSRVYGTSAVFGAQVLRIGTGSPGLNNISCQLRATQLGATDTADTTSPSPYSATMVWLRASSLDTANQRALFGFSALGPNVTREAQYSQLPTGYGSTVASMNSAEAGATNLALAPSFSVGTYLAPTTPVLFLGSSLVRHNFATGAVITPNKSFSVATDFCYPSTSATKLAPSRVESTVGTAGEGLSAIYSATAFKLFTPARYNQLGITAGGSYKINAAVLPQDTVTSGTTASIHGSDSSFSFIPIKDGVRHSYSYYHPNTLVAQSTVLTAAFAPASAEFTVELVDPAGNLVPRASIYSANADCLIRITLTPYSATGDYSLVWIDIPVLGYSTVNVTGVIVDSSYRWFLEQCVPGAQYAGAHATKCVKEYYSGANNAPNIASEAVLAVSRPIVSLVDDQGENAQARLSLPGDRNLMLGEFSVAIQRPDILSDSDVRVSTVENPDTEVYDSLNGGPAKSVSSFNPNDLYLFLKTDGTLIGRRVRTTYTGPKLSTNLDPILPAAVKSFIAGGGKFTKIKVGESVTALLSTTGRLYLWGYNTYGHLDVPAVVDANFVTTGYIDLVKEFDLNAGHLAVILADDKLYGWGCNHNSTVWAARNTPEVNPVSAFEIGEQYSVGFISKNVAGTPTTVIEQFGNAPSTASIPAGLVLKAKTVVHSTAGKEIYAGKVLACGQNHTVALKSDGTVVCWGNNDTYGQCTVPGGLTGVVAVAAGDNHTLALKSDGVIVAWGLNTDGQCTVPAGLNAKILSAGGNFSAAIRSATATDIVAGANNDEIADTIACWGLNTNGQCTVPKCEGLSYDPGTYKYRMRFWDVQCGWDHVVAVRKDNDSNKRARDHAELNRLAAGGERIAFALKSSAGAVIFPDLNFGSCNIGWNAGDRLPTCPGNSYAITEDANALGTFNSAPVTVSGRKYRIHVTTYLASATTYGLETAVIQSTTAATPTEGDWVNLELKHNSAFNKSVDPNTCQDTYLFPPGICYPATPYFITDITNLSVGWSAFGANPTWVVRQVDLNQAMVMYLTTGTQGEYFECTYATADAYDPGLDNKYVVWGNPVAYDVSAAIQDYQSYYPDFTWPGAAGYDSRQLEGAVAGVLAGDAGTSNTFTVNARALNGAYSYVGYGAQLGVNLAYLDSDYGYSNYGLFIGTNTQLVSTINTKTFMYVGPTSLQIAPLVASALVRVQTTNGSGVKYYGVPSLCLTNGTYFNRPTPVSGSNLNLYVSPDSYSSLSAGGSIPESQFIGSSNGAIHVERYVGSLPSGYSIIANAGKPANTHDSQTGFHLIWTGNTLPGLGTTTLVMTGAHAVLTETFPLSGVYVATLSLPFDAVYGLSSQAPIPTTWIAILGLQVRDVRVIKHQLQAAVVATSKHTGKPGKHITYIHEERVGGGTTYAYGLQISSSSMQRTGDVATLADIPLSLYLSQYVGYRSAIDIRTFGTTSTNSLGVAVGTAEDNKVASLVTVYGDNTKGQLNLKLMGPHGVTSLQAYIGTLVGPTWNMNLGQANIGHTQTPGLNYGFAKVTCSQFHTVAIDVDGSVHAWGSNYAINPASTTRGTWTPYAYSNTTCSATDTIPYLFTGYFRTFADGNDPGGPASLGILDNSLFAGADLTSVDSRNLLTYPSALPPASICKGLFDTTGFTMLDISGFTLATGASLVLVSQQVAGPGIKIGLKNEAGQYRIFASDVYDNNTIYSNALAAAPKLLHLSLAEDPRPVGVTYGSAGIVAQLKVDGDYIQWDGGEYTTPAVSGLRYRMFMDYFGGQGLGVSLGSSLRKNMPSTSLTKLIASNTAFLGLYLNEAVASDKLRGSLVYPSAPGANAYYYSDLGSVAETTQGAISDGLLDLVGPNDYYLAKVTRNYKQATLAAPTGVYQSPNLAVPTDIRVAVGTNFKIFVGDIFNDFDGPTNLSYAYNHFHVASPSAVDLNGVSASLMVWPKVVFPADGAIYNNTATTFDPASVYIYREVDKLILGLYTSTDHYSCSVADPGDGAYDAKPLINSSGTPLENIIVYDSVSRRVLPQSYYPAANISGGLSYIALGEQLTAVVSSGNVKHWGWNHWEQRAGLDTLQLTAAASPIAKIRCSATWSLSLKTNGSAALHTSTPGGTDHLTPPTGTYVDIAAGITHAAGVKTGGAVVVWGYPSGAFINNQPPAGLVASNVACGAKHTVARTTAGGIVCWGSNEQGQCTIPSAVANLPAGGVTVTEIACTQYQTVCRLSTGVVYWWGGIEFSSPGAYSGNSGYVCNPGIGTSKQHVFVVKTSDLRVYAPGVNTTQPADENDIIAHIPATANVTKLGQGITALHMCACTASSTFAWGTAYNINGQYAAPSYIPTTTSRLNASVNPTTNTAVGPYKHVAVAIPAGGDITAAVAAIPSAIRARNEAPVYTASELAGLAHVVDIAAGNNCLYAIQAASSGATEGTVVAWGLAGSDAALSKPTGNNYTQLSARQRHAAALSAAGVVLCWGANTNGQSTVPGDLGSGCTMVACGDTFTAAIKSTGFVACWGSLTTVPAPYNSIQFSTISCGVGHVVGRASVAYLTGVPGGDFRVAVGDVLAFGANDLGQCDVPGFSYTVNNKGINCQAVAGGKFTAYSLPSSGFSIADCDGMLTYAEELEDVTATAIQTSELAEGYLVHTAGALCAGILPQDHPFAVVKPTSSLLPNRDPFGVAVLANTAYSNISTVLSNATAIPTAYTRAGTLKAKLVTAGRYAHSQWVRPDHTFGAGYTIIVDQTTDRVTVVGGELLAVGCDAATYTPPIDALALRAVPITLGEVPLLQLATFRGTVYALDTGGVVTKWGYDDSTLLDYSIDATAKQYISIPDLAISDSLSFATLELETPNTNLAVAYVSGIPGVVDSWSVDVRLDRYLNGTKTNIRKFTALGNSANYSIQNHVHFAETFLAVDTWPAEATRLDSQYVLSIIPRGVNCKVNSASLFAMNLDSRNSQQVRILNDADNMSPALTQVADFMLSTTSGSALQYSPLTNTGQATALSVTEDLTGVKVQTAAAVPESCYLRNSYGSSARVENLITTGAVLGGRVPAVIALTPATAQAWPTIAAWYATEGLTGAVAANVSTWPQAAVGTTVGALTQLTTTPQRQPAVVAYGALKGAQFDSTASAQDSMAVSNNNAAVSGFTYCLVYNKAAVNSAGYHCAFGKSYTGGFVQGIGFNLGRPVLYQSNVISANTAGTQFSGNGIMCGYSDGSTYKGIRVNGTDVDLPAAPTMVYTATTPAGYHLGGNIAGVGTVDRHDNNDVYAEVLAFESALTLTQLQEVEGYLAWKFNLQGSLPGGHPYKAAGPVQSTLDILVVPALQDNPLILKESNRLTASTGVSQTWVGMYDVGVNHTSSRTSAAGSVYEHNAPLLVEFEVDLNSTQTMLTIPGSFKLTTTSDLTVDNTTKYLVGKAALKSTVVAPTSGTQFLTTRTFLTTPVSLKLKTVAPSLALKLGLPAINAASTLRIRGGTDCTESYGCLGVSEFPPELTVIDPGPAIVPLVAKLRLTATLNGLVRMTYAAARCKLALPESNLGLVLQLSPATIAATATVNPSNIRSATVVLASQEITAKLQIQVCEVDFVQLGPPRSKYPYTDGRSTPVQVAGVDVIKYTGTGPKGIIGEAQ